MNTLFATQNKHIKNFVRYNVNLRLCFIVWLRLHFLDEAKDCNVMLSLSDKTLACYMICLENFHLTDKTLWNTKLVQQIKINGIKESTTHH